MNDSSCISVKFVMAGIESNNLESAIKRYQKVLLQASTFIVNHTIRFRYNSSADYSHNMQLTK